MNWGGIHHTFMNDDGTWWHMLHISQEFPRGIIPDCWWFLVTSCDILWPAALWPATDVWWPGPAGYFGGAGESKCHNIPQYSTLWHTMTRYIFILFMTCHSVPTPKIPDLWHTMTMWDLVNDLKGSTSPHSATQLQCRKMSAEAVGVLALRAWSASCNQARLSTDAGPSRSTIDIDSQQNPCWNYQRCTGTYPLLLWDWAIQD